MLSFAAALARVLDGAAALGSERVALGAAAGRYLAETLRARADAPAHPVAMRDGYALAAARAGEALAVTATARAGAARGAALGAGEAARIFTGAPVPEGADCVIMQEYAAIADGLVRFRDGHGPERHIRAAGSDFRAGATLAARGARLTPGALVAAAAADVAEVAVARRPRVSVLATGDELAAPGAAHARAGAIPDSAGAAVAALAAGAGGEVAGCRIAADDRPALEALAARLLAEADVVVVIGGASVGDHDHARAMFAPHGIALAVEGAAIRPGRPVWYGRAQGRHVLGLPGNPGSALVTAALFLRPLLERLQGGSGDLRWLRLPLAAALPAAGPRETFARARWDESGLAPVGNQDSGAQAALAAADWLVRCPAGAPAQPPGALVPALAL